MVLKKKQILVATMVMIIGTAGYLNWSYDAGGTDIAVNETSEDYIPIGESHAVFSHNDDEKNKSTKNEENKKTDDVQVNKNAQKNGVAQIKLDRDSKRSESIALIKSTIGDAGASQEMKVSAQQKILEIADKMDKEQSVESLVSAKGLADCAVYITDEGVNVIMDSNDMTESQREQIRDIVYNFTQNNNIKIVELNE